MRPINTNSETWRAIADQCIAQINSCRDALEKEANEITTTRLRGKIQAYRDVLSWPDLGRENEPAEGIKLIP